MFFNLPYELQEMIMEYTSFFDCIKHGYIRIAKKLYHPEYCYLAILNKNYKILSLLDKYQMYNNLDNFVVHLAINSCDLKIVSIIYKNFPEFFTGSYLDMTASNGCLDIVKFLHKYVKGTTDAMDCTSMNGHYDTLVWLHENGYNCTSYAMDYASKYNYLNIVKWLHENGKTCTKNAMDFAAKYGHLDILIWLHENRTEGCTLDAINHAIALGHLPIVEWMFTNRYSDINIIQATAYAIKYDREAILDYICKFIVKNDTITQP
jgi:Ankyrin repeats (3 copies)